MLDRTTLPPRADCAHGSATRCSPLWLRRRAHTGRRDVAPGNRVQRIGPRLPRTRTWRHPEPRLRVSLTPECDGMLRPVVVAGGGAGRAPAFAAAAAARAASARARTP